MGGIAEDDVTDTTSHANDGSGVSFQLSKGDSGFGIGIRSLPSNKKTAFIINVSPDSVNYESLKDLPFEKGLRIISMNDVDVSSMELSKVASFMKTASIPIRVTCSEEPQSYLELKSRPSVRKKKIKLGLASSDTESTNDVKEKGIAEGNIICSFHSKRVHVHNTDCR